MTRSNALLKRDVTSAVDFSKWIYDAYELLSDVSTGEKTDDSEDDFAEGVSKKGVISRKAIGTYFKQWEFFAKEKLGPSFSIEVREEDASPLTSRLNDLEEGASRTWTTILSDITEAKTSTLFQKRATALTDRATFTSAFQNVDNYNLELAGRSLKIQLSSDIQADVISQFVKAMKAQFLVYAGKGNFNVSLQSGNAIVTVSLPNAKKPELKKIEEMLFELI
jgi:hypothetical protein